MNRSKRIEDLIKVRYSGVTYSLKLEGELEELLDKELRDHLTNHFLSCEYNTPEYIEITEGNGIIFWSLEELVACYIDNVSTWRNV